MTNINRRGFIKALSALGMAVGAKMAGIFPEGQMLGEAKSPAHPDPPWYARKAVQQTELKGAELDAAVKQLLASADHANVAVDLPTVSSTPFYTAAVDNLLADGTTIRSIGIAHDEGHFVGYHELIGGKERRTSAAAFRVKKVNGKDTALLVGSSDNGQQNLLVAGDGPGAFLTSSCPCNHYCNICCSWDSGIWECCISCGWSCFGGPVVCALCFWIWCNLCLYWHCNWWCSQCVCGTAARYC